MGIHTAGGGWLGGVRQPSGQPPTASSKNSVQYYNRIASYVRTCVSILYILILYMCHAKSSPSAATIPPLDRSPGSVERYAARLETPKTQGQEVVAVAGSHAVAVAALLLHKSDPHVMRGGR